MVTIFPFTETKLVKNDIEKFVRFFSSEIEDDNLLWHWDEEERIISPTHETDWKFQMDNELPKKIEGEIRIPKGLWHRIIKGSGDLELEIQKIKN
jgi:hypothetical protein